MTETRRKRNNYINNASFYNELLKYHEARESGANPQISNYIGECILLLCNKLSDRPNFNQYTYKDEMIDDAVENCLEKNTKISTIEYGPIEICKIVNKEVTIKCKDGIWRKAQVKSYGVQKLYEYGFGHSNQKISSINQKVIATKNHRWFVEASLNKKSLLEYSNKITDNLQLGDMLENASTLEKMDDHAIIHGIIFGDGSIHKSQTFNKPLIHQQGNEYAFMRVCKKDIVSKEIIDIFNRNGYSCTYPPSANGDPVYYLGKTQFIKELPYTNDPSYIKGFIYGWWLADGTKTRQNKNNISITSSNKKAVDWLCDYASYAGLHVTTVQIRKRKKDDGSYKNGKDLYMISIFNDTYKPRVRYIKEYGEDEVFCLEEPVTNSFVISNGLLTGNCIMALKSFNPHKSNNPFGFFSRVAWNAFVRRIKTEKKQNAIKHKNYLRINLIDSEIYNIETYNDVSDQIIQDFEESIKPKEGVQKKIKNV